MSSATLVAGPAAVRPSLPAGVGADLLWAAARPADCLEHVYCEPGVGYLRFVLFVRARTLAPACAVTDGICRRALEGASALRGWHLVAEPCPCTAPARGARR